MARNPGRPKIPSKDRKQPVSISLLPVDLKKIDAWCKKHGVSRSQIVFDAIRALDGSIQEDLGHLRSELADQEATSKRLEALVRAMQEEMGRLQASQELADAIVNPYQSPDQKLTSQEKEKARTLRAILINESNYANLRLLAIGEIERPPLPVFADVLRAWGSWGAAFTAATAAKEAKA